MLRWIFHEVKNGYVKRTNSVGVGCVTVFQIHDFLVSGTVSANSVTGLSRVGRVGFIPA